MVHNPAPGYGGSGGSSGGSGGAGGSSGAGGAAGGGGAGGGGAGGGGAGGGGAGGGGTGGGGGAIAQGRARVANKLASLEIKDTGNAKLDAMGDVLNNALAPFHNAPPAEQGAIGVVNQAIGAVMGLQNVGMELMNTGFAMATAGIAAMMPAFPAAFLTVPHIGMPHAHSHPPSLIPPAPPVPLPSIGTLMLAGSVGVLISGMPAGRCGDLGLAVTCGSLAPAFDVFLGSSNTFIAGNRAARMTDMTRHCNPASAALAVSRGAALFSAAVGAVGVIADAVGGGPVMGAVAQIAADLAAAAMSALLGKDPGIPPAMGALMMGAPNVLIGGFPCPNLPNPLDAVMHGLKCLGKAIAKSKALGKILKKVGLCNSPGEPINPFTGEVYNDFEDFKASDSGFVWERHYRSGWNQQDGPLGYGFRHFYDRRLTFYRKRAVYETHDNEVVALERLPDGSFAPDSGFTLEGSGARFVLTSDRDETLEFELVPGTSPPSARLTRYKTAKVDLYLFYDDAGRLRALSEFFPGLTVDTLLTYGNSGHIEAVQRGARGQQLQTISRYSYYNDCIVEWYDAMGAVARMRYDDARRMVQGTDRRGYSFHWEYDPRSGRCIGSQGDDGLWGVKAKYEGSTSTFTEPDGGVWTFKHYPDGVISHLIDPCGGVLQYLKDDANRIEKQLLPSGVEVTWLYSDDGKLLGREDQWQNLLPPEDDVPNLPDPLAHDVPENQRDWLFGRPHRGLVRQTEALPYATQLALEYLRTALAAPPLPPPTRDLLGHVIARPTSDGSIERLQIDAEGNVTARLDAKGNWWLRQIVSWNLLGAEKTATGAVQQFAYTHRALRKTWVDANGNRSDYLFDQCQRVQEMRHQGGTTTRLRRAPHGAITEKQDALGATLTSYEFGVHGLPSSAELASGEKYTFDYDDFGNCTQASSGKHAVERQHLRRFFFHDMPFVALELRDGKGVRHGYDNNYLAKHSVYFEKFVVEYRLLQNGKQRVFTPVGGHHDFFVTENGEVVRENGNGTTEVSTFDAEDRLIARLCARAHHGAATQRVTRYRYAADNELIERSDTETGSVAYGYDADHRLVTQQSARGLREYAYDGAGNLTRSSLHRTFERLAANRLSHTDAERFEYDDRGRISKRTRWDGRVISYKYDSLGQLIESSSSDTSDVWRAAYDGLGRRIWREFAGKRTDFYWDGNRLAAEVAPDGRARIYVYANTDALVPFMWLDYDGVDADPSSGRAFYLFTHGTGMPTRVEDQQGQVVWQVLDGDAYGLIEPEAGASVDVRLRFAGHFFDEHLRLFYNRFRDYDPTLARYLQPDPIDLAGGINLYAYPSNPLVLVDLLGLFHKLKPKPLPEGAEKPPYHGKKLEDLNPAQLKKLCKWHADQLAKAQDGRKGGKNRNTFAVGAIKDKNGNVHLVATSNRNTERKPSKKAREHMEQHGIHDMHNDAKPRVTRETKTDSNGRPVRDKDGKPIKQTVNQDTGKVHDKDTNSTHHAEQRMNNLPDKKKGETLVAQSPSQPCCPGCQKALSKPDSTGQKPIDKIPTDRQKR